MNTTGNKNLYGKIASIMLIILLLMEIVYALISTIQFNFFAVLFITSPLFLLHSLWIYCVVTNKGDNLLVNIFLIYIVFEFIIILLTIFNIILGFFQYNGNVFSNILVLFQMFGYVIIESVLIYIIKLSQKSDKDKLLINYKPLIILISVIYFFTTILSFIIAILDANYIDFFYTMLYPPFEIASYIFTILWLVHSTSKKTVKELVQLEPKIQPTQNTKTTSTNEKETLTVHEKIEILKGYKELLDTGIITQEEFEAKKKEIL